MQAVVVGADRIAANGDTANKIGTYGVAVLARRTAFRFMSRRRPARSICRSPREPRFRSKSVIRARSPIRSARQIAPEGIGVYNPAFDVTPAELITAIVCEKGVIRPVNRSTIAAVLAGPAAAG